MERSEMEILLQAVKRIERKLDTVIRAIYEHDEDIQDEYGRSQRTIDAGLTRAAEKEYGDVLGCDNESRPPRGEERGQPIAKRSPEGEANPIRDNGKVQGAEFVSRGNGKNQDVSRKDGVRKHASSKSNASGRGHRGGGSKGGFNGKVGGSN